MATNATLLLAIRKTVSEVLNISEKAISSPILSSNRRVLLSGMSVSYDINVTSHRSSESFKQALMDSVTAGDFVTLFNAKSGVLLEETFDLQFIDYSPTSLPTSSPSSLFSNEAGKKIDCVNVTVCK